MASRELSNLNNSQIVISGSKCLERVFKDIEKENFEIKNLAVLAGYQGKGIAKLLIAELKLLAKSMGASILEVGTGNASLSQLALYQKCGFRMYCIEPNFFESYPKPIFENGIRCIDLVRLRVAL